MDDVFVRLQDLPGKVRGLTVMDSDGNYNVYLNSCLNYETRLKVLDHEMRHINRGHFNASERGAWEAEGAANSEK